MRNLGLGLLGRILRGLFGRLSFWRLCLELSCGGRRGIGGEELENGGCEGGREMGIDVVAGSPR